MPSRKPKTSQIDYRPLLRQWSREILANDLAPLSPVGAADRLGTAPASAETIATAEARLGVVLPPSYRAFLATSDGWDALSPFVKRLRSTATVDWFVVEHENIIDAWSGSDDDGQDDAEYFDYATPNPSFRGEDLRHALLLSDGGDGDVLLNPRAVTPDGEWECWFLASWIPGANRYASFAHWLVREYESFRSLAHVAGEPPTLPRVDVMPPGVKRKAIKSKRLKPPKRAIEALIADMASTDETIRAKAAKEFAGRLTLRARAERRPDWIEPLTGLFRSSVHADVRSLCVQMITQSAPDGPTPPAILEAFDDADPWVVVSATWARQYFDIAAAIDPLLRFVGGTPNLLARESAMSALGGLGDTRAIPVLAPILLDASTRFDQSIGTAAMAMAECGTESLPCFVDALRNADARIRHAAVIGLDVLDDPRTIELLRPVLDDVDPHVRARAAYAFRARESR